MHILALQITLLQLEELLQILFWSQSTKNMSKISKNKKFPLTTKVEVLHKESDFSGHLTKLLRTYVSAEMFRHCNFNIQIQEENNFKTLISENFIRKITEHKFHIFYLEITV